MMDARRVARRGTTTPSVFDLDATLTTYEAQNTNLGSTAAAAISTAQSTATATQQNILNLIPSVVSSSVTNVRSALSNFEFLVADLSQSVVSLPALAGSIGTEISQRIYSQSLLRATTLTNLQNLLNSISGSSGASFVASQSNRVVIRNTMSAVRGTVWSTLNATLSASISYEVVRGAQRLNDINNNITTAVPTISTATSTSLSAAASTADSTCTTAASVAAAATFFKTGSSDWTNWFGVSPIISSEILLILACILTAQTHRPDSTTTRTPTVPFLFATAPFGRPRLLETSTIPCF